MKQKLSLILLELDVLFWDPDLLILSHNFNDLVASYWPHFTFDYSNMYSHSYFNIPDYKSHFTPMNILFRHSELYWFVHYRMKRFIRKKESGALSSYQRKSSGPLPLPIAAQTFERNLRTFVNLAQSNGIEAILGSQPLEPSQEYFDALMKFQPYNSHVIYPLHDEFVQHHHSYNKIIQ